MMAYCCIDGKVWDRLQTFKKEENEPLEHTLQRLMNKAEGV